jgi:hypothetical protein
MADQKHEHTATAEGMPEAPPPVDNDHVLEGAEQFDQPRSELELLRERVHEMEETLHTFLTHQTSVGHDRISTWLSNVKHRFSRSITPEGKETSPPSAPATEEQTESSTSTTSS